MMTRPCPFCGGTNLDACENDRGNPTIWCKDCRSEGPECDSRDEAIKKWNKRDPNQHLFELEQKPLLSFIERVGEIETRTTSLIVTSKTSLSKFQINELAEKFKTLNKQRGMCGHPELPFVIINGPQISLQQVQK